MSKQFGKKTRKILVPPLIKKEPWTKDGEVSFKAKYNTDSKAPAFKGGGYVTPVPMRDEDDSMDNLIGDTTFVRESNLLQDYQKSQHVEGRNKNMQKTAETNLIDIKSMGNLKSDAGTIF